MEGNLNLNREIGVFGLSAHIVNMVVGSGIFVLPAIVFTGLGPSSIFAYLLCAILVAMVMLCFAEAGSAVTDSGGAYLYVRTAFGPYFGFLTAILFVMSTVAADAAVANAIIDVLGAKFSVFRGRSVRLSLFFILFAFFGCINVKGIKQGIVVVQLVTMAKLVPLILLISLSWSKVGLSNLEITLPPSIGEIAEMSLVLFFAFQGTESALSISGEVRDPQRTIPKSIFISTLVIFLLYILVQTVAQGVLGTTLASYRANPLGAVASRMFGDFGFIAMTLAALVSMLGYLGSSILSMPRVLFQAAKDNVLPLAYLAMIHPRFHTPFVSILCYVTLAFICTSFGGFQQLAIISSASILLIYLGVSLAVVKFRMQDRGNGNGFRIPGGYLVPVISSLIVFYVLTNVAWNELEFIVLALAILTILYFFKGYWNKGY